MVMRSGWVLRVERYLGFENCEGDYARAFVRILKRWSWNDLLSMFGLWGWM